MDIQNIASQLTDLSETFNLEILDRLEFLDNEFVSAGLSLFLLMYAGMAAPQLPQYITVMFNNIVVRIVTLFLVVYMSSKNATIALVTAIGLVLLVQFLNKYNLVKMAKSYIGYEEGFSGHQKLVDFAGDVVSEDETPFDLKTHGSSGDEASNALRDAEMDRRMMEEEALPSTMVNNLQEIEKQLLPNDMSEPEKCMGEVKAHECEMKVNSRNVPYHQYVDRKLGLYSERDSTGVVKGWDISPKFAAY